MSHCEYVELNEVEAVFTMTATVCSPVVSVHGFTDTSPCFPVDVLSDFLRVPTDSHDDTHCVDFPLVSSGVWNDQIDSHDGARRVDFRWSLQADNHRAKRHFVLSVGRDL